MVNSTKNQFCFYSFFFFFFSFNLLKTNKSIPNKLIILAVARHILYQRHNLSVELNKFKNERYTETN